MFSLINISCLLTRMMWASASKANHESIEGAKPLDSLWNCY